ncbi:MAG: ABC transporter ATP-binding protein/permease, partial [Clostridia bacterium]|nr:ABC transporter ATP-binding protein/permease [Clostridia bacterium]
MLQIKQITKEYKIGKKNSKNYQIVKALNGVDLSFRQSEFVSILGPSGCGKTTMLNIIGGLDKYTNGDLIINGKSTKEYKDKDWDNYRNHSIGFVFQSYNLIHHQTILHNVELALTLSGVKRKERKERALKALDMVGLKDRANAKPNQLSGGQMQRVAIARAIVNDPDIILADEPTGALDSKTSVQIMKILKKLSKTKLVIMVTHNPELAEEYSTRIVKLKDGEVVSDTDPYTIEPKELKENIEEEPKIENALKSKPIKKPKKRMSFFTALSLSFKNLLTKKARTILVSFAGSIGIIGIALILAVSSGFSGYIDKVQEDTLSSYPIVIEEQSVNYMNIVSSMMGSSETANHDKDAVYSDDFLSSMLDSLASAYQSNDMKSFNAYLQENYNKIEPYVNSIKYGYNLDLHIYNKDDNTFSKQIAPASDVMYDLSLSYCIKYLASFANIKVTPIGDRTYYLESQGQTQKELAFFQMISNINGVDTETIKTQFMANGNYTLSEQELKAIVNGRFGINMDDYKNSDLGLFNEMIDNTAFVHSQYKLLAGSWNNENLYISKDNNKDRTYADMVLVLDKNNELDEYLLYALGLLNEDEIQLILDGIISKKSETIKIDYNKIVGKEFKLYLNSDTFDNNGIRDNENPIPVTEKQGNYIMLRISGIVRPADETKGGALDSGLVYSKSLTDECINRFNLAADEILQVNPKAEIRKIDKSSPSKISIYANNFHMKQVIEDFINEYNANVGEDQKITYTDYMGLMMGAVSSIVDIVSYVLIAFVSVSLIVSSIMIGIITYISVLERTKEIGVLRSVG